MDELPAALDAITRHAAGEPCVWEATNTTILFVTHDVRARAAGPAVVLLSSRPGRSREGRPGVRRRGRERLHDEITTRLRAPCRVTSGDVKTSCGPDVDDD
jgi:NitT/TauT family transport system ATP-binding protein